MPNKKNIIILASSLSGKVGIRSTYRIIDSLHRFSKANIYIITVFTDEYNTNLLQKYKKQGIIKDFFIKSKNNHKRNSLQWFKEIFINKYAKQLFEAADQFIEGQKLHPDLFLLVSDGGFLSSYMFKYKYPDINLYWWLQDLPFNPYSYFLRQTSIKNYLINALLYIFFHGKFLKASSFFDKVYFNSDWNKELFFYFTGMNNLDTIYPLPIASREIKDMLKQVNNSSFVNTIINKFNLPSRYIVITAYAMLDRHFKVVERIHKYTNIRFVNFGTKRVNRNFVINTGWVTEQEKYAILSKSLGYLALYDYEGFGLVAWEAMLTGAPVFTIPAGPTAEFVRKMADYDVKVYSKFLSSERNIHKLINNHIQLEGSTISNIRKRLQTNALKEIEIVQNKIVESFAKQI